MKKRIFTIFLIMILAVTNLSVCYAENLKTGMEGLLDIDLDNYGEYLNANDFSGGRNWVDAASVGDAESDSASGIMAVIISILTWLPKQLVHVLLRLLELIVPMMDVIIFNGEDQVSIWNTFCQLSYFDPNPGTGMAGHMVGFVSAFYQVFRYVALIGFIVAIAVIAVKMILSSIGKQKQQYKEGLKNWLVGLVLLVVGHWIMIYSIYFSDYLVSLIYKIKEAIIRGSENSLITAFSDAVGASAATAWGPILFIIWAIMAIIAIVIFVSMNLKIFKVYLERVIVVGVLIMIFPLVTIFYAFEKSGIKKGSTFESWLRTFMDQVFIQPVHALTLVCVIIALNAVSGTAIMAVPIIGMLVVLMVLNMMFSIENIIKRVFAINGAALGAPVNPMGAAMAGVGMAAGVGHHMKKAGKDVFDNAKNSALNNGKSAWVAKSKGRQAKMKEAAKYLASGKSGIGNMKSLAGLAGLSLPDAVFDVEKLSQKEQRDATKHLKRAAATKDISKVAGAKLRTDVKNLEFMADPTITAVNRSKFGITDKLLNEVLLNGGGTASEKFRVKMYLQTLADPATDISVLMAHNNTSGVIQDINGEDINANEVYDNGDFGYYVSASDESLKTDLGMIEKLAVGKKPTKRVIRARRVHELKHAEEYEVLKTRLGLDDKKIEAVEDGTSKELKDILAYELLIKKCGNPAIDVEACKDSNSITGDWDEALVHSIDMSEEKIKENAKKVRVVGRGRKVDDDVVTTRKVYEANHPKEARKIRTECPLKDEAIIAIEAGNSTYTVGTKSYNIEQADILEYDIMIDRMANGRKHSDYCKSDGTTPTFDIFNGVTMEMADRFANASDLIVKRPNLKTDKVARRNARSTLVSFRNVDEGKFYSDCMNAGVDLNEIINFMDGTKSKCTSNDIFNVLTEVSKTK